jgi:uncharacterized protein YjiS (DUF1127 family)
LTFRYRQLTQAVEMPAAMRATHGTPESFALVRLNVQEYKDINTAGETEHGFRRRWRPPGKGIIMNVARSFNNWRKYRQTVTELGRMSTRELNDLGISRSEITSVARAAVR